MHEGLLRSIDPAVSLCLVVIFQVRDSFAQDGGSVLKIRIRG